MGVTSDLEEEARRLLADALNWLRTTYPEHRIVVERDLVWTLQKWLMREVLTRDLALRVFNDYGVEPGSRRSLSADLALVPLDSPVPLVVAEFKFEPSHRRVDIDRKKLPVVGWDGVVEDVSRIKRWVDAGMTRKGLAAFVDEGGFAHDRRTALPDCEWSGWGTYGEPTLDVWVHAHWLALAGLSGPLS
jgi:hypothetical protein